MIIFQVITLSQLGGAQSVVINLANKLSEEHEVIAIAGEGDGKMWKMLRGTVRSQQSKYLKRAFSPINDLLAILELRRLYRQYKPEIIHLHSSKAAMLGRIAFPRKKIVYTVHGFDSIRVAYRKYLPIERMMQARCKAVVGVSLYDQHNLLKEGITHNVTCVYNGISKLQMLKVDPFSFCNEYKFSILCIARLSPPKNIDLFLEIASGLPDFAFIWIGNQYEFDGKKSQNVFFMGNIPNAGSYNEYADLFLLTSNYEGLPITIIEAMSFGKPIVASNVGGISEIVVNDVNGYVLDNNAGEFVEKIKYVLENKDVYDKFSANSRKIYEEKLTVDKMVGEYMKIYQS